MADFTIGPDDVGVYELAIPGGHTVEIAIDDVGRGRYSAPELQVIHHSGTTPLYARTDAATEPQDPRAVMVMPASFAIIPMPDTGSIWLASAAPATVSVART